MSFMDFLYNKDFFYNINNVYQGAISIGKVAIRGLFSSIYTIIAVPSCVVVYKFFQVLKQNGVIASFENTLTNQLNVVTFIANNCFSLILEMKPFLSCIANASTS